MKNAKVLRAILLALVVPFILLVATTGYPQHPVDVLAASPFHMQHNLQIKEAVPLVSTPIPTGDATPMPNNTSVTLKPDSSPIGRHCGGIGLIGEDACGCTWGVVRFEDDPQNTGLEGAVVKLLFAGDSLTDVTAVRPEEDFPYYGLSGENLGARRGDVVTLHAQYADYSVSVDVTLGPDEWGEQRVDLILPYSRPDPLPTVTPPPTPETPGAPLGWPRGNYDLGRTNFYPHASSPAPDPNAPFAEVWSYPPEGSATSDGKFEAVTGDVNGDGFIEIVMVDGDVLKVLTGDGIELWATTIGGVTGPIDEGELRMNFLDDITEDGVPEIFVSRKTNDATSNIYTYDGDGNLHSMWSRTIDVAHDGSMEGVALIDTPDGGNKLVATMHSNYSGEWRGGVLFDAESGSQPWFYAAGVGLGGVFGDLDNDGWLEMTSASWVTVHNGASGCGHGFNTCTTDAELWNVVLEVDGREKFSRMLHDRDTNGASQTTIADLDGDGADDILVLETHYSPYNGPSQVHRIEPSDGSILHTFVGSDTVFWRGWAVADLDGDGDREVVVADDTKKVRILDHELNLIREASSIPTREIQFVNDINGDGHLEIVLANHRDNAITVLRDDLTILWSGSYTATGAMVSDLNNDGVNDLVLANYKNHELHVLSQVPWSPEPVTPVPTKEPLGRKTLILVNPQRLAEFYPSQADRVPELMDKLDELASRPVVSGTVVSLDSIPEVSAAYAAWDTHWPDNPEVDHAASTTYANVVTDAIKHTITTTVKSDPEIWNIVMVGDDRIIPYRRVNDRSPRGFHEHLYKHVSVTTTVGSAMAAEMILTDDFYGDTSPEHDPRIAHIPDRPVGRLVETPAQITTMIDAFLASDDISGSPALVAGYDLLKDLASKQRTTLQADGVTVTSLIGDTWGDNDLRTYLLVAPHHLNALNIHSNHFTLGTPQGSSLSPPDVVSASGELTGAVVFSPGCQAGLNVPGVNGQHPSEDFPEAFAWRGASFIGNTGYGIGDRWNSAAWSERLMAQLTGQLTQGDSATIGDSLLTAKRAYYAQEGNFDGIDEKVMLQVTLYGLPMHRVRQGTQQSEVSRNTQWLLSSGRGTNRICRGCGSRSLTSTSVRSDTVQLVRSSVRYEPPQGTLQEHIDVDGHQYYTLHNEMQIDDQRPVQPKRLANLEASSAGLVHGVLFKGGLYSEIPDFKPAVIRASIITGTVPTEEPLADSRWYPSIVHDFRTADVDRGARIQEMSVQFGQYIPSRQLERLFSHVSLDTYYSNSDDWDPPIAIVQSIPVGNRIDISVHTADPSGIHRVVATFTANDGHWRSVDLVWDATTQLWEGKIPASESIDYFIQVVDNAGNVLIDDSFGLYYEPCTLIGDVSSKQQVGPDGIVNVYDIQYIASQWRQQETDVAWGPRSDLDQDGDIDVVDVQKAALAWGEQCELQIPPEQP